MHRNSSRAAPACVLLVALAGCAERGVSAESDQAGPSHAERVAEVDGVAIGQDVFDVYAASRSGRSPADLTAEQRAALLDDLLRLYTLGLAAEKEGLASEPEVRAQLELQRMGVLAQRLLQQFVAENPVTEEDVRSAYAASIGSAPATEYKARHILLETEEAARDVIRQLDDGADFTELAKTASTGPSGPSGGDLGWFTSDQMVEPFAEAVAAMQIGTYSKSPVQTQFGWHVILAEDRREVAPPALEAVSEQLEQQVQQARVSEYVSELQAKARIVRGDGG